MIREAPARELIASIEDPSVRVPIGLIVDSLVEFYGTDPTQLHGAFDLVFFVHVLEERIDDVSGLLRGTVSLDYWGYPPELMPVEEAADRGPTGLRYRQAYNYAARLDDEFVRAALLSLANRADVKQTLLLPTVKRIQAPRTRHPGCARSPCRTFGLPLHGHGRRPRPQARKTRTIVL
jgi:hypothetical protein